MLTPSELHVAISLDLDQWFAIAAHAAQVLAVAIGGIWAYNRYFSRNHVRIHANVEALANLVELEDGLAMKIRVTVHNVGLTRLSLLYEGSKFRIDGMTGSSAQSHALWQPLVPDIYLFEEDYNDLMPAERDWKDLSQHNRRKQNILDAEERIKNLSAAVPARDSPPPQPAAGHAELQPSTAAVAAATGLAPDISTRQEKRDNRSSEKKLQLEKEHLMDLLFYTYQFVEAGEQICEEHLIRIPAPKADEMIAAYRVFAQLSCKRANFRSIRQAIVVVDGGQPSTSDAGTGAAARRGSRTAAADLLPA